MTEEDELRDVLTRWTQTYADQAWADWSELFTADGSFTTVDGQVFVGHTALRDSSGGIAPVDGLRPQVTYVCAPAVIRIEGARAWAGSDFVAYSRSSSDSLWQIRAVGRLMHELTRLPTGWRVSNAREWAYFSGPETPAPLPSVVREDA